MKWSRRTLPIIFDDHMHPKTFRVKMAEYVNNLLEEAKESEGGGTGSGLTDAMKDAFLAAFANVAWADGVDGQAYYDALAAVLQPGEVTGIEAVFDTTVEIQSGDPVDSLRPYLTVTATYADGSAGEVAGYTLSGTLAVGENTITVTYGRQTATFVVEITTEVTDYLVYTTDDTNMTMTITNLNITKIVEDQLNELVIPDTINGYHVIIG